MRKKSHPLWSAESDAQGRILVNRATAEREDLDSAEQEFAKSVVASAWGLFGASLVDDHGFGSAEMPVSIRNRFNMVAKELKASGEVPPKVRTWQELDRVLGSKEIESIRRSVADGMKVRQASKFYNLPFVVTADILEDEAIIGKKAMKSIVTLVKTGKKDLAIRSYGKPAQRVAKVLTESVKTGSHKIAIDQAAVDYWTSYYGEFGKQLTTEVKKRIRADVANEWLRRNGVDDAAAEYWQSYFSETGYGKALTETLPKKLSPSKAGKVAALSPWGEKTYNAIMNDPEALSKVKETIEHYDADMDELDFITKEIMSDIGDTEGSSWLWSEVVKKLIQEAQSEKDEAGISHPGTMIGPPGDDEIINLLYDWHGGQGDPVYAVASSWHTGKSVSKSYVDSAISNLERTLNEIGEGGENYDELAYLVDYLKDYLVQGDY